MNIIAQGAEAIIYKIDGKIKKVRIEKSYRVPELDHKIRSSRTRHEAKIMNDLADVINVPKILRVGKYEIEMEYVDGKKMKEAITPGMCLRIGKMVGKIHSMGIMHGDLTTSNMILKDGEIYLIDFGLSRYTKKIEDYAVDLLVFKQCLKSTHTEIFSECWKNFLSEYLKIMDKAVVERIEKIEKRRRYS